MSTALDSSRRRPTLWSYISFGSSPRRRSVSLPTRTTSDPFEKADRHSASHFGGHHSHTDSSQDSWMTQAPRSRLLRATALVVFLVVVFFFLAPGERQKVEHQVENLVGGHKPPVRDPKTGETICSKPYHSGRPLKQYALMIDAGSTGSRIHVYRFNNCGPTPELEDEDFMMTEKRKGGAGLSAYGDDPEAAAKSLDPLMERAMKTVPEEFRGCSPVAVKATAGLRILGDEKSNKILDAVRARLETAYPFPVVSRENQGVVIMDGKDEGVYAWITTNYLLGKIGGPDHSPTAAVFDLGGGSTQIVFEPSFGRKGAPPGKLAEGDHKYKLDFGGQNFELYQHSHLHYGLMAARESIHKVVAQGRKEARPERDWHAGPIEHPCIPPGMTTDPIEVKLEDGSAATVRMMGPAAVPAGGTSRATSAAAGGTAQDNEVGATTAAQCRGLAEKILNKSASCGLAPCSFNGVHQPSLAQTFSTEDIYIFSYFYDRLQPLGMPESFTLRELRDLAARVCAGPPAWGPFESVEGAVAELRDRPEHCLDLNFMLALLHTGYDMPLDREVRIAKKIEGKELGWCLGATLPLLAPHSGWECKIREV